MFHILRTEVLNVWIRGRMICPSGIDGCNLISRLNVEKWCYQRTEKYIEQIFCKMAS